MNNYLIKRLLTAAPLALGLLAATSAQAQHVQWAARLVAVSSQKADGKDPFAPSQVLGVPNALPLGQISNEAWIPRKEGPNEFIEVRFARSVAAQQVTIVENFNPGSITKVELVDTKGVHHEVYANANPGPLPEPSRTLEVKFPAAEYRTLGVKVYMNTAKVEGINQLDAIGIADVVSTMVKQAFTGEKGPEAVKSSQFDSSLVNLGPNVNSRYVDTHPVISPNGRTLYFAREGNPGNVGGNRDPQDVWYSTLISGKNKTWSLAKNMGGPINTPDDPNGLASVSANGQSAILINIYNRDGTIDPQGCSLSKRTRMGWTQPVKQEIKDFVNLDKEHVDFFLATSGRALLMAVERPEGRGGQDLFVSFPVPETTNTWSKPISLGPNVNTDKSDFAPFLAADNKTLYFASDGRGGYGKSDIFYTKRLDDSWTNWSPPRNLGPVVNSPDFDAYYTISAAGQDAYLVSSRNGIEGSRDIFRISLAPAFQPEVVTLVTGKVLDVNTGKPIRATIHYENLLTGEEIGVAETDPVDGSYTIVLPSGVQYGYRAEAKGYIAENANLDVTAKDKYSEQKQDLFLVPFNVGQTVKLNNIFFQQSKYYLTTSSYPELLRLIRIMKDYPTVEIKLSGHTDNQGDPALNLKLSQDRVNEVKKYLGSHGIKGERVTTEGFGDTKPLASNDQEETRMKNRRVEFTITKK
ncbi:OmpA family protein [Hymenobacter artigasi]|uniref:Outer membrane protein OmpA-like peptidoglycan-associated protein n=1 Tax=Hymenobacter artigasi TaxID=2719616 RepID=A0ABX1HRS7_9BACT|nr:OmpA family protein [Hymenobacter artigasi]NKI92078.1 outer membrane protein OmpA-like peptidoglycan-associated protein [Hymenobacter artigasi]